jgi:sugar/nucleoside kinase (ribokinase family)
MKPPRIAALGLTSWDTLLLTDRQPSPSEQAIVRHEFSAPGGTTTNTCVALARLGARVTCMTAVGEDPERDLVLDALEAEGIDVSWSVTRTGERTDRATVIVSEIPPDRSIIWHPGAQLRKGDRIDIYALFDHDIVFLDFTDPALWRFLTDLPAHFAPRTRLLGGLNYLADRALPDRLELALRHDTIVGSLHDLAIVTGAPSPDAALDAIQAAMRGANLRAAAVTDGARGSWIVTEDERWPIPVFPAEVVDATGAGDAYAAGIAWGMALRWPWPETGRFASAMGALATRAAGAQASLPALPDVEALLAG